MSTGARFCIAGTLRPLQVLTWFLTALQMSGAYLVVFPLIDGKGKVLSTQYFFGAVYGILSIFVVALGLKLTLSDPTDPALYSIKSSER